MSERVTLRGTYELVGDLFAGGGGASMGIELSTGRPVDFAINHSPAAIAMHMANHPDTEHYQEDIWGVDPQSVTKGRPVGLLWASPDCTHHSNARGGKPKDKNIRGLAWAVTRWAAKARPRVIMLENVREFESWGPLNRRHHPRRNKRGQTFRRFVAQLQALGYEVQFRKLIAANYGAPTSRLRLFMIARCDGEPIVWPTPTHAPRESAEVRAGLLQPWRAAYECIDFSIPCPSIFLTREQGRAIGVNRPLVPATLRRIAAGLKRFVLEDPEPFIVRTGSPNSQARIHRVDEPWATVMPSPNDALVAPYLTKFQQNSIGQLMSDPVDTVMAGAPRFGLVTPYLAGVTHSKSGGNIGAIGAPLRTVTTSKGGEQALIYPTLVQTGYGEREGQAPRALDIADPLGTVVAGGGKHGIVQAEALRADFVAKHFGDRGQRPGVPMDEPIGTVTAVDHHSLVSSNLVKLYGTNDGSSNHEPMPTVTATGQHLAEVRAFLVAYFGQERDGGALADPMRTVTSKERFGLVYVQGVPYEIVDIGMRMFTPRELFRAQGFPEEYVIDVWVPEHFDPDAGRVKKAGWMNKTEQIAACGNSVPPAFSRALVAANYRDGRQRELWRGYELAAAGGGR